MRSLVILALFALLSCNKSESTPTENRTPPPPSTNLPTLTSAAPAAQADITTEEDFEDEAEKDITADNYEKQLGALEKEIP